VKTSLDEKTILRDLGNGIVLRRSTSADAEPLAEFNARIQSDIGADQPDPYVAAWTRDLLTKPHPTFSPGDFTIVQDTTTGAILSAMNLISQTWSYGGILIGVGRPELVSTLPEYRNRGFVRFQFEVVHQWSAERGELVQAITGIPYFYRLFGYEFGGLNLAGGRYGYQPNVPKLKQGEEEPYRLRPAIEADLDFIASLYQRSCQRYLVCCLRDEALWRYELTGKSEKNVDRMVLRIIEAQDGEPLGFLGHPVINWEASLPAQEYELKPGISWEAVTPSVIRYLWATGESNALRQGKSQGLGSFGFMLDAEHPVFQVLKDTLPHNRKPYAWYLRVPDLPAFLRHITPVLERRLAVSAYSGYTGELKLTFYRSGIRLVFEAGCLVKVEDWQPVPQGHSGDAAFPGLTFLQLLFGYRTLEELGYAFTDCWWENDRVYGLLNVLFPKQVSDVWPVS